MTAWEMIKPEAPFYDEHLRKVNAIREWLPKQSSEVKRRIVTELVDILANRNLDFSVRSRAILRMLASSVDLELHGSTHTAKRLLEIFYSEFESEHIVHLAKESANVPPRAKESGDSNLFKCLLTLILIADRGIGLSLAAIIEPNITSTPMGEWMDRIVAKAANEVD